MSTPLREFASAAGAVQVFPDPESACRAGADRIAAVVRSAAADRGRAVLGLATGGTPGPLYDRLVALHRSGELSFAEVSTYNLDEYYPISPLDRRSYRSYMQKSLFDHVNIHPNRAHVLDGTVPEAFVAEHAAQFERWIESEGGVDLQLLGIGRNGHIGFNEPVDVPLAEALSLHTRLIELHPDTKTLYARDFGGERNVPRALTVGVATILASRSILVLAFGPAKADPVARSLKGPMTSQVPGSLLQAAREKVVWMIDEEAARGLD